MNSEKGIFTGLKKLQLTLTNNNKSEKRLNFWKCVYDKQLLKHERTNIDRFITLFFII